MTKPITTRKTTRVQIRLTIAEHNDLMRQAVNEEASLSDIIRKRAKLHTATGK
jgi:hypothetical protein